MTYSKTWMKSEIFWIMGFWQRKHTAKRVVQQEFQSSLNCANSLQLDHIMCIHAYAYTSIYTYYLIHFALHDAAMASMCSCTSQPWQAVDKDLHSRHFLCTHVEMSLLVDAMIGAISTCRCLQAASSPAWHSGYKFCRLHV